MLTARTYRPPRPRVGIADDDPGSRALLRAILERDGCAVEEAADGAAALDLVAASAPDVLLLDVDMPFLDGIEVARRIRSQFNQVELPLILVTGHHEIETKVLGLDAGATDFVTKPYEAPELVARVRAALRTRAAFEQLETAEGVIAALANAVEAKDPTTERHCSRLAVLALALARRMDVDAETLGAIASGAVLHDIGKIGVAEAIIRKTGALTEAEWLEMRRHSIIGADIVEPLRLGRLVAPIVRGHHERWDGRGYPDGLAGRNIPLGARVVGVVDAYDAMVHDRPYRTALSQDHARAELLAKAGAQFDPDAARAFVEYLETRPDSLLLDVAASDVQHVRAVTRVLTASHESALEQRA